MIASLVLLSSLADLHLHAEQQSQALPLLVTCSPEKFAQVRDLLRISDLSLLKTKLSEHGLSVDQQPRIIEVWDKTLFGVDELESSLAFWLQSLRLESVNDFETVNLREIWPALGDSQDRLKIDFGLDMNSEGFDESKVDLKLSRAIKVVNGSGDELWLKIPDFDAKENKEATAFAISDESGESRSSQVNGDAAFSSELIVFTSNDPSRSYESLEWKRDFFDRVIRLRARIKSELNSVVDQFIHSNRDAYIASGLHGKHLSDLSEREKNHILKLMESPQFEGKSNLDDWRIVDEKSWPTVEFKFRPGKSKSENVYILRHVALNGDPSKDVDKKFVPPSH